jgi:hypothetical protein
VVSKIKKSTKAFPLSLIAGILILTNTILLGAAATWFPGIIPTLPGSTANDTALLYRLSVIGLICGIIVFLGAILLHYKPSKMKAWGVMILVFSIPSVLTGGGFIIGFILGIAGGVFALLQKPNLQIE